MKLTRLAPVVYLAPVIVAVAIAAVASFPFLRSGHHQPAAEGRALTVAASFYPLYFFAQQIAGDAADVTDVTPPGSEPHDYEPTAQDMTRIEHAKARDRERRRLRSLERQHRRRHDRSTRIVVADQGLTHAAGGDETAVDPHVWMAPLLAQTMVKTIAQAFDEADPDRAAIYTTNAAALESKLGDLDVTLRDGLAHCAKKDIITSHAAFGYLAAAYHLNQIPIAGLSTDAEPSPRQLASIAELVKRDHVSVIFFERLVSSKLSETLAAEVGARTNGARSNRRPDQRGSGGRQNVLHANAAEPGEP